MTIAEAQETFLNKRVRVKKGPKNPEVCGICQFVGPNKVLNWPLQITIDRMPLTIDSLNQISLEPEPWSIKQKRD